MEGDPLKKSLAWLHGVLRGKMGHGIETRVLQGQHVIHAKKGFMQFDFVVPNVVCRMLMEIGMLERWHHYSTLLEPLLLFRMPIVSLPWLISTLHIIQQLRFFYMWR
ncbi:hypothetical protein Godav_015417 [Gossypium davidsonii]|uniref:Uncharacterized protein n=1 Tax=Gossypium davidsonii TaxID=34287 RepID=A0A7J8RNC1_GOSDV|nr:hypothetical protein [Gossypium davidsonii]